MKIPNQQESTFPHMPPTRNQAVLAMGSQSIFLSSLYFFLTFNHSRCFCSPSLPFRPSRPTMGASVLCTLVVLSLTVSGQGVLGQNSKQGLTNLTTNSTQEEVQVFWEYELSLQVQAYAGLIIVLVGISGNVIVIAVLSYKGKLLIIFVEQKERQFIRPGKSFITNT